MNPQVSPWMIIADRQRQQSIQRELQQRQLQKRIKSNYNRQLMNQIEKQKQLKRMMFEQERNKDKGLIKKAIQQQQRTIQIDKLKALKTNEKQLRLDLQNQFNEKMKRERDQWIKNIQKDQEKMTNKIVQEKIKILKQQQERKKQILRQDLKNMIDFDRKFKKLSKEQQGQFEDYKLKQLQKINVKMQQQRQRYLNDIKRNAATIDYGSHKAFEEVKHQTLVQRKKQQWQIYKDSIEQQERLKQYQKYHRMNQKILSHRFRSDLKDQIKNRQKEKQKIKKSQFQEQRINAQVMAQLNSSIQQQKFMIQKEKKRILQEQLQNQMMIKLNKKYQPYMMAENQLKINNTLLRGSNGIMPGQTYNLDPSRKKQLQTVNRSVSLGVGQPLTPSSRYLVQKGKSIFY